MEDKEREAYQQKIAELKKQLAAMDRIKKTVRRNFQDMAYLLTSIMALSNRYLGGHVRRVGEILKMFTTHLRLGNDTIYLYYYAALFHDIGLVGTDETIVLKQESELTEAERREFIKHPAAGEKIIGSMYNLKRVALIIRSHHEEYSGGGYPDGLYGDNIPVGARFLRVANDYDNMQYKAHMNRRQALLAIEDRSGIVYDPRISEAFCEFIRNSLPDGPEEKQTMAIRNLRPGTIIDEEIYLDSGMMLIPKGMLLTREMIEKLSSFSGLLDMDREITVI